MCVVNVAAVAALNAARSRSTHHLLSFLGSKFHCTLPDDVLRQSDTARGASWSGNGSRRAFATVIWYLFVTDVLSASEYVGLVFMMCHTVTVSVTHYVAYAAISLIYDPSGAKLASAEDAWSQHVETVRGSTRAIPTPTHAHEAALFAGAASGWTKVWRVIALAVSSPEKSERFCAVCGKQVGKITEMMRHACYATRFGEPSNDSALRSNASLNARSKSDAAAIAEQRKRDDDDGAAHGDDGGGDEDDDEDDKLRPPAGTRAPKRARQSSVDTALPDTEAVQVVVMCAVNILI
jgi:hypothetical protein